MSRVKQTAGFTLIEALIGLAVAGVILLVSIALTNSAAQSQSRQSQALPVAENVRASLELIANDLRESSGPRVLGTAGTPAGLLAYASDGDQLTIVSAPQNQLFGVRKPGGLSPAAASKLVAGGVATALDSPNPSGSRCADLFGAGGYFLRVSPLSTGSAVSSWGLASGCAGETLNHSAMTGFPWSPSAMVLKVNVVRYRLGTYEGQPALLRQIYGQGAQVVALGITGMGYQVAGGTPATLSSPGTTPTSVQVTLSATADRAPLGGGTVPVYSDSETVFLRRSTLPNPGFDAAP